MFIAIDGGDGSGKGVQIGLLKTWLEANNHDAVYFRDPGDTQLGEAIRSLLLDRKELDISPSAEAALFMASRAQLVHEKIRPALEAGKIVLVDRYLLSTVVYQGYANMASEDQIAQIWKIGAVFAQGVLPDLTFILDCPASVSAQRLNRPKDRIEEKGSGFHERVAEGYRQAARSWTAYAPGKVCVLDATMTPEVISRQIIDALQTQLASTTP